MVAQKHRTSQQGEELYERWRGLVPCVLPDGKFFDDSGPVEDAIAIHLAEMITDQVEDSIEPPTLRLHSDGNVARSASVN